MNVTVNWYDESKTIIHYQFFGKWNWLEFWDCWNAALPEVEALDHPFSVLMDMSGTKHLPQDSLVHLRTITRGKVPNFSGASAYVGLKALGVMYERLMHTSGVGQLRFFFVPTLEEGIHALIEAERELYV